MPTPWSQPNTPLFPIRRAADGGAAAEATSTHPWLAENEGALSVDVLEYPEAIVVRAPIAGVRPEDLDLSLHHDMLTIRGKRTEEESADSRRTLHQECHWGPFSRSIILPAPVRSEEATAELKNGILTIRLPKTVLHGKIPLSNHESKF
ncbi:Hsp20/alpha crystallin family protein [Patescibacteria group bacterium]|nr:MAG: Hsp20/alpha crystallin family protein [Patescibacteria group bacterium]